jgi:tetratricopeptide (TPR) repeat protein
MIEDGYIDAIEALWPSGKGEHSSPELLRLSEEAVEACPTSAELWVMRGNVIELADESCPIPLEEALGCYRRALTIDPGCSDALEEIGFFYDVHTNDLESAESSFRAAIALGGSASSFAGLARVLQEMGRSEEALGLLSAESCPYHEDPTVSGRRKEIEAGEWLPIDEASAMGG